MAKRFAGVVVLQTHGNRRKRSSTDQECEEIDLFDLNRKTTEAVLKWAEHFNKGSEIGVVYDGDGWMEQLHCSPPPTVLMVLAMMALRQHGYKPNVIECQCIEYTSNLSNYLDICGMYHEKVGYVPADLFTVDNVVFLPYVERHKSLRYASDLIVEKGLRNVVGIVTDVLYGAHSGHYGGLVGNGQLAGSTLAHKELFSRWGVDNVTYVFAWTDDIGVCMKEAKVCSSTKQAVEQGLLGSNVRIILVADAK